LRKGQLIHNVPVLGGLETLLHQLEKHSVEEVLVAVPSATGDEMRRIVETCEKCSVGFTNYHINSLDYTQIACYT